MYSKDIWVSSVTLELFLNINIFFVLRVVNED